MTRVTFGAARNADCWDESRDDLKPVENVLSDLTPKMQRQYERCLDTQLQIMREEVRQREEHRAIERRAGRSEKVRDGIGDIWDNLGPRRLLTYAERERILSQL